MTTTLVNKIDTYAIKTYIPHRYTIQLVTMVSLKLADVAKRLGKNISQIAEETGLNRNTVTALYHGKVDGIKFETLEVLCRVYHLSLSDILQYEAETKTTTTQSRWYRQEGEVVPFTCWPWLMAMNLTPSPKIKTGYEKANIYFCQDTGYVYWDNAAINTYAKELFRVLDGRSERKKVYTEYKKHAHTLEELYQRTILEDVLAYDIKTLLTFYNHLWHVYEKFWHHSIFIDSFDAGIDQELIRTMVKRHKFTPDEVAALTTPQGMTFHQERLLMLTSIAKRWARRHDRMDAKSLRTFIQTDPEVTLYRKTFDYIHSNYAVIRHISEEEIYEDILQRVGDKEALVKEHQTLVNYPEERRKQTEKVLKRHNLKENPLAFFEDLTFWREHRKKINLMGFHLLDAVLQWLERKTGIARPYLTYLCYDEVEAALKGSITLDALKQRREEGMMVMSDGESYQLILGAQAKSLREELEDGRGRAETHNILQGQVASQGYVKARARIILTVADFPKFQDGEVLITGMTRPEFVPLMKRASAIVTNEGGITCHAAIVSRELGKPCIIGTKNATDIIKDGDIIEVRATHGTIRILSQTT